MPVVNVDFGQYKVGVEHMFSFNNQTTAHACLEWITH